MRTMSLLVSFAALVLPLVLLGCVELQGQRISIYNDAEQDRLLLLLHYDGVHDSGSDEAGNGVEQIRKAVQNGDIMILDWPFHLDMSEMAAAVDKNDASPEERGLIRSFLDNVVSHPLGTYRDADGHIGVVQAIQISNVSELLRETNRVIGKKAESDQGSWIRLEGHSLVIHFEVEGDSDDAEELEEWRESVLNAPQPVPFSIANEENWWTLTLGQSDIPSTVRFFCRPEYEPSLEASLEKYIPERVDKKLISVLLESTSEPEDPWLRRLVEWGPVEEHLVAVLMVAKDENDDRRDKALAWLKAWRPRGETEGSVPATPQLSEDRDAYLLAWEDWYRSIYRVPWQLPEQ